MLCDLVQIQLALPRVINQGILLDGFPRTLAQAQSIAEVVDAFILIDVDHQVCIDRVVDRRMDPMTGAIYNLSTLPPAPDVVDRLVSRKEDTVEVITHRLKFHDDHINRILPTFEGRIHRVDGLGSPDEVCNRIIESVSELLS